MEYTILSCVNSLNSKDTVIQMTTKGRLYYIGMPGWRVSSDKNGNEQIAITDDLKVYISGVCAIEATEAIVRKYAGENIQLEQLIFMLADEF